MNSSNLRIFLLLCWLVPVAVFGQQAIQLKLQLINYDTWGVYAKPMAGINPGPLTITGTAMATVVMPKTYDWNSLTSVHGTWNANAIVDGPIENPTRKYVSFGLNNDYPHINYVAGQETLLFKFKRVITYPCPDSIYLINNATDPFNQLPNSMNTNPGNEFSVFDPVGPAFYEYHSNYAHSAWSCHDNDGDGILNAFEDTNGNGVFDPGVDASDLNQNYCTVIFSNAPDDVTVCSGNDTVFVATASMPQGTFNFGWQYSDNNGANWEDIDFETMAAYFAHSITGVVSSGSDTLTVKNVAGMYGRRFRSVVNPADCNAVYSNYAILSVEGPLTVNTNPVPKTVCSGYPTIFQASFNNPGVVGSTIYRWQVSVDGGLTWTNIYNSSSYPFNGTGTSQLSISNVAGLNGFLYRLSARTSTCNTIYTEPALLTVEGPITVIQHPEDFTDCADMEAYFYAKISNPGQGQVLKQWQMSTDNGNSWADISEPIDTINGNIVNFGGIDSDTLLIAPLIGMNGYKFRNRIWTNSCVQDTTFAATLHVEGPLTFTDQPDDITLCEGDFSHFSVAIANATGFGNMQYQWQRLTAGGWLDLTNSVPYSGAFTPNLSIIGTYNLNNSKFRCKVKTGNCNWVTSSTAMLTVEGAIIITDQPNNVTQCSGEAVSFTVGIANSSPQGNPPVYQWQESTNGGASWHNVMNDTLFYGVMTNHLSISSTAWFNGYKYRCLVSTTYCNDLFSDAATVNIEGPITVTDEPDNVTVCTGTSASFQAALVNSGLGVLQYQWEVSTDNGATWANLSNDGNHSGVTTTTLSVADVTNMYNYRFRMRYRTANCNSQWTNWAVLTIPANCPPACIKFKLQLLPDSSGWAVMAKPFGGYVPTANAMTTAGRVTLVAPANFVLDGLTSIGGTWTPTSVLSNVPGHTGRKYITFELATSAQGTQIGYDFDQATTLFQFEKNNGCPDSLYLLETDIPNIPPNELNGGDTFGQAPIGFEYCGIYARKAWRCKPPGQVTPPIIIVETEDSLSAPQPEVVDRGDDFSEGNKPSQSFTLAPNPAGDFVNIVISKDLAEGQTTLALWDLQGRKHQEILMENTATQLDLSGLPAGVYLVSLAQNGRVVERKKLVKN